MALNNNLPWLSSSGSLLGQFTTLDVTGFCSVTRDASTGTATLNVAGGVSSLISGAGISVSSATGDVTVSNIGVTSIAGTTNQITASASTGAVTLSLPSMVDIEGLTITGSGNIFAVGDGTVTSAYQTGTGLAYFGTLTNHPFHFMTNNANAGYIDTSQNWTISGYLGRQTPKGGWMNGGYAAIETGATAGAIYTIGGPYVPNGTGANPLGNMYGIGFTDSNTINGPSGTTTIATTTSAPVNVWGLYVATDGTAQIFLDGQGGGGYFTGPLKTTSTLTFNATQLGTVNTYGSFNATSVTGGYAGVEFSGVTGLPTLMLGSAIAGVYNQGSAAWQWYISSNNLYGVAGCSAGWITTGICKPASDNAYTLGASGARWSQLWAATATINTSDAREKTAIAESVLGLSFINRLHPVSYKWLVGGNTVEELPPATAETAHIKRTPKVTPITGARTHYGLIAQEVKAAIDAETPGEDFAGWVLSDKNDPESQQGLRYEELIAPMIKAIQELSAKVIALEAKIAAK